MPFLFIMHTLPSTNTSNSISNFQYQISPQKRKRKRHNMKRHDSDECAMPRYIGVRKRKWGRWVTEIREPGKKTRIWLGSFDTPEMAAAAYDVAAWHLKGPEARTNFPKLVESLPKPTSADPDDVRGAAQRAAMQMGAQSGNVNAGPEGVGVPGRVELSQSDIQALHEVPLDSPKMWMQDLAGTSMLGAGQGDYEMEEWDEMENYPIWD